MGGVQANFLGKSPPKLHLAHRVVERISRRPVGGCAQVRTATMQLHLEAVGVRASCNCHVVHLSSSFSRLSDAALVETRTKSVEERKAMWGEFPIAEEDVFNVFALYVEGSTSRARACITIATPNGGSPLCQKSGVCRGATCLWRWRPLPSQRGWQPSTVPAS